ncbi:hypothetical protein Hanom_Chr07g00664171 [Helianthus anomalus]
MHHVVALIAERQVLIVECYVLDAKLLSSSGSHWKQPLYLYAVEVRMSTSYPSQTLS